MSSTYMLYAFVLGRLLFGGYFIAHGLEHYIQFNRLRAYAASKRVPLPALAVGGSGLLALFGGVSLVLGYETYWGLLLLVLFLLGVTPLHNFWAVGDPEARLIERLNLMRNMALFGAVIMMVAIPTPWRMSFGSIEHARSACAYGSGQISPSQAALARPALAVTSAAPSRRADISRK
jgi:putative oxidoreductase